MFFSCAEPLSPELEVTDRSAAQRFRVDSRAVIQLGRESIKDPTTAVLELVKNSYDADARKVVVNISQRLDEPFIEVVDDGDGMSRDDLLAGWLRIGYSTKSMEKVSAAGRRRTGEKGVGRISADRLGSQLTLVSKSAAAEAVRLTVDWEEFAAGGKNLEDVPVLLETGNFRVASTVGVFAPSRGTVIRIDRLRQHWTDSDLEALRAELSILLPPEDYAKDFRILLHTDSTGVQSGAIESPFQELAEIELEGELAGTQVSWRIRRRLANGKRSTWEKNGVTWEHVRSIGTTTSSKPRCGPVRCRLRFFARRAASLSGTGLRLTDLKAFLDQNAGVRIYRDRVRVRPYGDAESPEGDWLGLAARRVRSPAGVGSKGYRIAPNQLVGAVYVSRDKNEHLADSAGREGLIHGEAYADLRSFVRHCVQMLEVYRTEHFAEPTSVTKDPREGLVDAKAEVAILRRDLQAFHRSAPAAARQQLSRAIDQVDVVAKQIAASEEAIKEALFESGVLRGLASVGIAATVFGHETQSAISAMTMSLALAAEVLTDQVPDLALISGEIEKASEFAGRVSAWGSFALARARRDKRRRRKFHLDKTVHSVIGDLSPALESASIAVTRAIEAIQVRGFEMDYEAALLNLLTNAYYACLQRRKRAIHVSLKRVSLKSERFVELSVADSGLGVPHDLREKIWTPLFTTKKNQKGDEVGTGLGLSIVKSVVDDNGGSAEVQQDKALRGARFVLRFPDETR